MIDHEIDRITAAVNRLRPDWPVRQLDTLIREHLADRPRRDVAVALTWVACETATTTPYRVLEHGPWWLAVGVDGQTTGRREPYNPLTTCGICGRDETFCRRNPNSGHQFITTRDDTRNARKRQP